VSTLRVDLYSDTRTRPTPGMRRAIAEAEVGDEQADEDPTVTRLCARVAALLGKEAALYAPSGTMCNQIAYRIHCRLGDEVIADRTAHTVNSETGGPAALSGVMMRVVEGRAGIFRAAQVNAALRDPAARHQPRSRLVSIENTSNQGGGTIWPLGVVEEVAATARAHGLAMHMDGARLMNAVIATGVAASAYAAPCDSVWIDFSKGLGAPVGAVLAGSQAFIREAWRCKQQFGGAMRQAGVIAAACLYALDHHVERLAEDHANARALAAGIAGVPGLALETDPPETNMVFFDVGGTGLSAAEVAQRLLAHGVRIGATRGTRMRAVTHLDIPPDGIAQALVALRSVVAEARSARRQPERQPA